jgi:hypothetical protein
MDQNKAICAYGTKALYYFLYPLYILIMSIIPMTIDKIRIDLVK